MSGAVGVVLTIFILMGVGMLLTHIGWIGDGASSFLSKFVVKVALTATVIQNMFGKFTAESLKSMAAGLVLPFAAIAIVMCLGILIAKRLHMPQNRFGAFVCTFTFSNSVFIGLPVCNALFGEDSATPVGIDALDAGLFDQCANIVWNRAAYGSVAGAGDIAFPEHVPQCDPVPEQKSLPLFDGDRNSFLKQAGLRRLGSIFTRMSGSGSAVYGVFHTKEAAQAAADRMRCGIVCETKS